MTASLGHRAGVGRLRLAAAGPSGRDGSGRKPNADTRLESGFRGCPRGNWAFHQNRRDLRMPAATPAHRTNIIPDNN